MRRALFLLPSRGEAVQLFISQQKRLARIRRAARWEEAGSRARRECVRVGERGRRSSGSGSRRRDHRLVLRRTGATHAAAAITGAPGRPRLREYLNADTPIEARNGAPGEARNSAREASAPRWPSGGKGVRARHRFHRIHAGGALSDNAPRCPPPVDGSNAGACCDANIASDLVVPTKPDPSAEPHITRISVSRAKL